MNSRTDRNLFEEYDIRESRADRNERHGRTYEEARELCSEAAKSASICGVCFRPLAPTDSVTMTYRKIGKNYWVRIPVCLFCTLDDIKLERWRGCDPFYREPHWHRVRCLNCGRPLRIGFTPGYEHPPSLNARSCCADCKRLAKNRRNAERRRVRHRPVSCIRCGRPFIPKRDDAQCCSSKCRQALHRERQRAELGDSSYPLRKPTVRRERRAPR